MARAGRYAGRVSRGPDDDALSWGGDDDPTLDVRGRAAEADQTPDPDGGHAAAALPDGYTAVGRGADAVGRIEADGSITMPGEAPPMSSAMLVALGVVVGAYLLFTIGWVVGGLRLQGTAQFLVSQVGYRLSLWLAVAAPALWLTTVLVLTRTAKSWVRITWLIGGLVLLIPWPFVMVGAVGL